MGLWTFSLLTDDILLASVFMSQHQQICSKGARSWSVKRQHQSNQSIFRMMTFVIFRKQCKMISQFQKRVNTKFCLYDWASQVHRCTTKPLIHLQVKKTAIPSKTDYMPSSITGRLGLYFAIVILSKFPFSKATRLSHLQYVQPDWVDKCL